jgi:hypothetical protein
MSDIGSIRPADLVLPSSQFCAFRRLARPTPREVSAFVDEHR